MSLVVVSWIQPTLTAEFTGVGVTRMLEAMREVVHLSFHRMGCLGRPRLPVLLTTSDMMSTDCKRPRWFKRFGRGTV
jgi:hypothetical protein